MALAASAKSVEAMALLASNKKVSASTAEETLEVLVAAPPQTLPLPTLVDPVSKLFVHEGNRRVLRIIHYFLGLCARHPGHPGGPVAALDAQLQARSDGRGDERSLQLSHVAYTFLVKEINSGHSTRRLSAMRSMASFTLDDEMKDFLLSIVSHVLADVTGQRSSSSFLGVGTGNNAKTRRDRQWAQWAALGVANRQFIGVSHLSLFEPIVLSLSSEDAVAARIAAQLVYRMSLENPAAVATRLLPQLSTVRDSLHRAEAAGATSLVVIASTNAYGHTTSVAKGGLRQFNLADGLCVAYFIKTCRQVLLMYRREGGLTTPPASMFLSVLCGLVESRQFIVAFEAIEALVSAAWPVLEDPPKGCPIDIFKIIQKTLGNAFLTPCKPALHAVCRLAASIGEAIAVAEGGTSLLVEAGKNKVIRERPAALFGSLRCSLTALLKSSCASVRRQVLAALLWLSSSEAEWLVWIAAATEELKSSTVTSSAISTILDSLLRRRNIDPSLTTVLLDYTRRCVCLATDYVQSEVFMRVIDSCLGSRNDDASRSLVLQMLISLIESSLSGDGERIYNIIYWTLGEHASLLSRKPRAVAPTEGEKSRDRGSSINSADEALLHSLAPASLVGSRNRRGQYAVTVFGTAAMQAIVFRLFHAASFSSWSTRTIALTSLAKIAFRNDDPLRIWIYEYLVGVATAGGVSLHPVIQSYISILDDIYSLKIRFFDWLAEYKGELPASCLRELFRLHSTIQDRIAVYCRLPKGYLALGDVSQPYLAKAFDLVMIPEGGETGTRTSTSSLTPPNLA